MNLCHSSSLCSVCGGRSSFYSSGDPSQYQACQVAIQFLGIAALGAYTCLHQYIKVEMQLSSGQYTQGILISGLVVDL